MDSVDIYHGLSGQSGQCPWILWTKSSETSQTGQCPLIQSGHCLWTPRAKSRESRRTGQCSLSPWTDWTLSMDSLDKVQYDLVKKIEVKVASLGIYFHISF